MPILGLGYSVVNTGGSFGPTLPVYDADAQSFFTAVGNLTDPEKAALNTFVLSLKGSGIWNDLLYIWPLVGDQNAQRYNLRNYATGLITWNGAGTHNTATGYTPGADGYGNTGLTDIATNIGTASFGAYIRNDSVDADSYVMGCSASMHRLIARDGTQSARIGSAVTTATGVAAQVEGLIVASRNGASVALYKNGSVIGGTGPHIGSTSSPATMYLGAANDGANNVFADSHSEGQSFGMFFWGNISNHSTFYTYVQELQEDLFRQV